jgi:micrococcal nuclease
MSAQRTDAAVLMVVICLATGCGQPNEHPGDQDRPAAGSVARVIDGDTLVLHLKGQEQRVRLLGVDTPESPRQGASGECGSTQATANLQRLAPRGANARAITDRRSGDVLDRYGRLLAFVTVNGIDVGLAQIRQGWATVYAYRDRGFARRDRYERAYRQAAGRKTGIHRLCSAGGG